MSNTAVQTIKRVFKIKINNNFVDLPEIDESLSVEEIQDIYSNQYPQLLNSKVEHKGIDIEKAEDHYEFLTIAGTKG